MRWTSGACAVEDPRHVGDEDCGPSDASLERMRSMTLTPIGLLVAFGAGMVSFLAPCVLPLVPGYLSYLAVLRSFW